MRDTKLERENFVGWDNLTHKYGHHYAFHLELDHISRILSEKMNDTLHSFLDFNKKEIINRILQIVISSIYSEFSKFYLELCLKNKCYCKLDKNFFEFSEYKIDLRKKKISLRTFFRFKLLLKLFKNFFETQYIFLYKIFFSRKRNGKVALFFESIPNFAFFDIRNDKSFVNFIKDFPIDEFSKIENLYVESSTEKIKSKSVKIKYHKNILFEAICHLPKSLKIISIYFFKHWQNFFKILILTFKNPVLLLIQKDLVLSALYQVLNDRKIINLIFYTNSIQFNIPLNFTNQSNKYWRSIMLWYSSGCDYFSYDILPLDLFKVRMQYIRFDKTYVWSKSQAERLKEGINQINYSICPPITFYMPREKLETNITSKKYILIFDETPHLDKITQMHYGTRYKYWDINTSRIFLEDIITLVDLINKDLTEPFNLVLKQKRLVRKGHHHPDYEKVLDFGKSKGLKIANFNCNLFELINKSSLSIISPFASPAHICVFMKKKSIYYDPKNEISFIENDHKNIQFIKGKKRLQNYFFNEIYQKTLLKNT